MMLRTFVAVAAALCLSSLIAAPVAAEDLGAELCFDSKVLLDPLAPMELRDMELRKLQAAADDGGSYAQYLLGTLYRLGEKHPAALVPVDQQRAMALLGNAAVKGALTAMGGMAEIQLSQKKPMDAMIWAQALVFYDKKFEQSAGASSRRPYQASLLHRGFEALGKVTDERQAEMEDYLAGFISKFGAGIEAAHDGSEQPSNTKQCRTLDDHDKRPLHRDTSRGERLSLRKNRAANAMNSPGFAMFLVGVAPDGRVGQVLVVDSLPGPEAALGLMATVKGMRFNVVDGGAPMRYAYLPMNYDDWSVHLRD